MTRIFTINDILAFAEQVVLNTGTIVRDIGQGFMYYPDVEGQKPTHLNEEDAERFCQIHGLTVGNWKGRVIM